MKPNFKIAKALAAAGLAVILTAGTAFASVGTANVTADSLRLRAEASMDSAILATAPKGATVELLSEAENGWYKVTYAGKEGFMSAEWLSVVTLNEVSSPEAEPAALTGEAEIAAPEADSPTYLVVDGPLNIRSGAGTDYERVGYLMKGDKVTVFETVDGWCKVSSGSLTGFVSQQYLIPTEQPGMVISGPLNLRTGPGVNYSRIGVLSVGTYLDIISTENGWSHVCVNGTEGYVSASYLTELSTGSSNPLGQAVADMAESLVGCRYIYGASGPSRFDCSGLSYYIFRQLDMPVSRGASQQYKNDGVFVAMSDMEPGDLIFFFDSKFDSSGGRLPTTHMGIYVGNGRFVHASTTSYTVQYDNVYGSYYTPYIVGVKRII